MRPVIDPGIPSPRTRHRDRHGRGLRGSVVTDEVRLAWTTAERFDDVATAAVTRLDK